MRPRQFSDEELHATARQCFLEHGPGVSTSVIAAQLGVSQAALFKRCGTKQALLIEALRPPARPPWIEIVDGGPDERPVPEQLREVVEGIDQFFQKMMPALSVLHAAGLQRSDILCDGEVPPPTLSHRTLTQWFQRLHAQGRARISHPQSTAMAFLGAIHARHMLRHMLGEHGPKTEPEFLDNLVDVFWTGISP
ncbi:MAG: TetR/AcrR family transcriptional regulator [Deltaproteobacteria bacterium]|nr:TetR/AcrR family transcriptional regulator [Deltaproteobacteria bacterium]